MSMYRLTPYSINSVVLLTVGAVVLGLRAGSDRPEGETNKQYMMGFIMTVIAAVLYGFILPLVELSYKKAKQAMSFSLVMEYQLVMCIFATVFCTVGMLINKDFQVTTHSLLIYSSPSSLLFFLSVYIQNPPLSVYILTRFIKSRRTKRLQMRVKARNCHSACGDFTELHLFATLNE